MVETLSPQDCWHYSRAFLRKPNHSSKNPPHSPLSRSLCLEVAGTFSAAATHSAQVTFAFLAVISRFLALWGLFGFHEQGSSRLQQQVIQCPGELHKLGQVLSAFLRLPFEALRFLLAQPRTGHLLADTLLALSNCETISIEKAGGHFLKGFWSGPTRCSRLQRNDPGSNARSLFCLA